MTTKLKLFQDTLNRKFRRTAIIGNRNFKCTLNGVDSGVRSIIMNKGILWQCADTGHDRVTHVPNSSTGKSQAHTHTWCIWFIHSLARTHTHNSKQSLWTLTFTDLTRFIWPQGRNDGCTSPPSFFVHLSSPSFFLSLSHFGCVSRAQKVRKRGNEMKQCVCIHNWGTHYCRTIIIAGKY